MSATHATLSSPRRPRRRPGGAIVLAVAALSAVLLVVAAFRLVYAERLYPGVYVGPVYVGGQPPTVALDTLASSGLDPNAPIVLEAPGQRWELDPDDVGIQLDARATIEQAYLIGRAGFRPRAVASMLGARLTGRTVAPAVVVDEGRMSAALERVAAEYDRPASDAGFAIQDTSLVLTEAVTGRALNLDAARAALAAAATSGGWPLTVRLEATTIPPAVEDAGPALAQARALLSAPITLVSQDQSWDLPADELAAMLTPEVSGATVRLSLNRDELTAWLEPMRGALEAQPTVARFGFDEASGTLFVKKPGTPGAVLDVDGTAQRILATAGAASRRVEIALVQSPPDPPDTVTASDLGIAGLIHAETSHFSGSSAGRIHNIGIAASQFDGVLIPDGATFSFNQQVGDISADTGYEKTLIIMDGATADGVGGGVCQVSTTLFRTAFWAGLPIVERAAHGYRVGYYEQGGVQPGLDATIYSPAVDLKFKNDSGGWLLLTTETDPRQATLTFKMYGPTLSRSVEMEGPYIDNTVPPPPGTVELDPEMAPGTSKTVELARSGADVTLFRIVHEGSQEVRDRFFSHYRPTGEVVATGPELQVEAPPYYGYPGAGLP